MSFDGPRPSARDTQAQYARHARRYAESGLHRRGDSLETVRALAAATPADLALDIGTGTGFTAFALAGDGARVLAVDLTPEMLAEGRRLAAEMELEAKLNWLLTAAERLPFPDGAFPIITCRYASHHFHDLPRALAELARVARPGGRVVLCDVVAPEAPQLVQLMNRLERLRDPTHVWDYPVSQWRQDLMPAAGLEVAEVIPGTNPQLFSEWVHRSGTPPDAVEQLVKLFEEASREAQPPFAARLEGAEIFFSWDNVTILATKR
jgi:ubiquinone/menaquinone biosynthesis C-methylase UbiE